MIGIRLAKLKDIENISKMYVENWKDTYEGLVNQDFLDNLNVADTIKKWTGYIATKNHGIFIAEKEGKLMGFGAFKPEPSIENCLYLDSLHVCKTSRALGVGSKLIDKIGRKAVEDGYLKMNISIISGNEYARRLYVNRGGVHYEFEKIEFAGKPSNVEYLMWQTLDAFK